MLKKLFVCLLVFSILFSFPVLVSSEEPINVSIQSVLHNQATEITVILKTSGIKNSKDISVLLTNSQGSTKAEDIIYITQTKITQNGYVGIILPIDENRLSEDETYMVKIGFESKSGYIQKVFGGKIINTVTEFLKAQPYETADQLLSDFVSFNTAELLTAENAPFEGNLVNNLKLNCSLNNIAFNYTVIIAGDCNQNNIIGADDALLALQQAVSKIQLNNNAFFAGDINQNGAVESSDALLILQYSVNKISSL